MEQIPCPDCDYRAPSREEFILHRERIHYGQRIELTGAGAIRSQEAFGYERESENK